MTLIRETVNKYGGILQPDQIHRRFDNEGRLTPGQTELSFE